MRERVRGRMCIKALQRVIMKKFKNLCLVDTVYSLLLYLLYTKDDFFEDTFYVFGVGMPKEIEKKIPNFYRLPILDSFYSWEDWCKYRSLIHENVPLAHHYFCHDHLRVSTPVIWYHPYTLLEDSPLKCKKYYMSPQRFDFEPRKKTRKYFLKRMIYGPAYRHPFATNSLCRRLIVTQFDDSTFLKGKKQIVLDIKECWLRLSEDKKNQILGLFELTKEDLNLLSTRKQILFTQPLIDFLTEEEQIDIYQKMVHKYDKEHLIIKVHPRDRIDYEKLFSGYAVFKKKVPSELLNLLSIKYDKAITAFSAAVENLDYPIDIDWYGSEVHPKLVKVFGHYLVPKGANVCSL